MSFDSPTYPAAPILPSTSKCSSMWPGLPKMLAVLRSSPCCPSAESPPFSSPKETLPSHPSKLSSNISNIYPSLHTYNSHGELILQPSASSVCVTCGAMLFRLFFPSLQAMYIQPKFPTMPVNRIF